MRTLPLWAVVAMALPACKSITSSPTPSTTTPSVSTASASSTFETVTASSSAAAASAATPVVAEDSDPFLSLSKREVLDLYAGSSCDALTGTTGQVRSQYNRGLRGYVDVPATGMNATQYRSLAAFDGAGASERLANKLYLSQVNVPTRVFSSGFPTLNGDLFKNAQGNPLVEFFRIKMDGFIELPADMNAGDYEFAVLADDGAQLTLGATNTPFLGYTHNTETRMMCGNQSVFIGRHETLPMKLDYFQGPRYHIALMLLWRPAGGAPDPLCGASGNNRWFDSSQTPSVAQADFRSLESRGWSVVPPEAFRIPDDEIANPCQSDYVKEIFETCGDGSCLGVGI